MPALVVLAVSQPAGLIFALTFAAFYADPIGAGDLGIAALGGAAGMGALAAFYTAMAIGAMSIVAPIAAMGVVVPVGVGLAQGEAPGPIQLAGLVVAIVGVVVLSYEEDPEHAAVPRRSIVLALLAALGFGFFFTTLDIAATDQPGWAVVAARVGGVAAVGVGLLAVRPSLRPAAAALPVLVVIGGFDILANALFAVASTIGLLPVVAVGGSMYPAFTIALAHVVLGERLNTPQRIGVSAALAGVVMIAAGS
jgi:drug/metabolite transporter (DMT)-like permease